MPAVFLFFKLRQNFVLNQEQTVEKYIDDELKRRMPSFSMEDFMKLTQ